MRYLGTALAAACVIASAPASAQSWRFEVPAPTVVTPLPPGAAQKSVSLARMVVQLNNAQEIGLLRYGVVCEDSAPLQWKSDGQDAELERFRPIFFDELHAAGFKTDGDANNLFAASDGAPSDLLVGVALKNIRAYFCERIPLLAPSNQVTGRMLIDAEWQLYSPIKGEVIAKIPTQGGFELAEGAPDGMERVIKGAFAENVRQLAASETFRNAVAGEAPSPTASPTAPEQAPIVLKAASAPSHRAIADAIGSVVAIFAGDSLGSGFLVSEDGYLITNYHVVGDAKYVKVRWSDGFETVGEVIRSHRQRDVALVKTDPHGRTPLARRKTGVRPGDAVYAIGSPLSPELQGTVTKGIVSADRIIRGYRFIQSDVNINHGNSGGPLLDENGAVVGVADLGLDINGAMTGLNFFIPIGDALDFLALKPQS